MRSDAIHTDRLVLRPFAQADAARVVGMLGDLQVARWLARVPHPFTRAELRLTQEDGSTRWPHLMAITLDQEVIGGISVAPGFGYYLGRAYWGQGYGAEAARAAAAYGFEFLGLERIEAGVFKGNTASRRILARLGFQEVSRGMAFCQARNEEMAHATFRLSRDTWEARACSTSTA